MLCLAVFVANTTVAAYFLRGPEDRGAMYAFAAVWGVCLAWLHPTHASLYCTIIPWGQEGEVNFSHRVRRREEKQSKIVILIPPSRTPVPRLS